jgi:DNA-binding NtrC family response regulator
MEHLTGTRIRREATPATVNLRRCKLVVIKGAQRGTEFVIAGDVIRIGKAPENDLVLADETVSRVHFEIVRDAKGYLVRDMKSTNGTFLDSAEVKEAYLRAGSVIKAGEVELKFTPFEERIEILPSEKEALGEMVGRSPAMREIFGLVEKIAPTDATVLIEGETGTGKDMIARTLHQLSPRADKPFIVVDCGAVAGTLIESELFGHEKGAFTGASSARQGAFELAAGGTIFLDELGELSLDLQPKLLRVLEQRELRRVGGTKILKVDLRVVAATRKDLRSEVEKGKFREDLYFRLNVVPITAPSLRERREDIPLLIDSMLKKLAPDGAHLTDQTRAALMAHDWPGNVRELRNVAERYALGLREPLLGQQQAPENEPQSLATQVEAFERALIERCLVETGGRINAVMERLDIPRRTLSEKMVRHGLDRRRFLEPGRQIPADDSMPVGGKTPNR